MVKNCTILRYCAAFTDWRQQVHSFEAVQWKGNEVISSGLFKKGNMFCNLLVSAVTNFSKIAKRQ